LEINMEKPLVTIGIPTFNRADGFLKQALRSALAQSWPHIEIVVADNCSSDRTDELVAGFGDPRIRYFKHSENIGANNNFNFCVEQAGGVYFLLLHDDDLIDPDFVESCMNSLEPGQEVGIIRTGTRLIDGNGRVLREKPNEVGGLSTAEFLLGWFDRRTALYMCSTLFNTEKLRGIGGFSSRTNLYQDVVAEVKLAARSGRKDVREVKASFRRHDDNRGSAARTMAWCEDSLYLLDVMCGVVPADQRAVLRRRGMVYFCHKCYRNAANIKSSARRISTYWGVFSRFEYRYSPMAFFYRKRLAPKIRTLRGSLGNCD
jgi:glycosyltransferase involved in cell wall biosynthesis